jgi:hypothetical protein
LKLPSNRDHICDVNINSAGQTRCSFKAEWGVIPCRPGGKKKGVQVFETGGTPRIMCCDFHLAEVLKLISPFALVYRFDGNGEEG